MLVTQSATVFLKKGAATLFDLYHTRSLIFMFVSDELPTLI